MASSRMMRRAASFGSVLMMGGGGCVGTATVGAGAGVAVVGGGAGFVLYWPQAIEAKSIEPAAVMSHLRMAAGPPLVVGNRKLP
jgi:hypothetical protein